MATKAKVPVIPSEGVVDNEEKALSVAKIGFPVIIKAVAGGDRNVLPTMPSLSLKNTIVLVTKQKSFGNGDIYIEKFLEAPRHIEIQVLGDQYGNVIHLGERDCSFNAVTRSSSKKHLTFYF